MDTLDPSTLAHLDRWLEHARGERGDEYRTKAERAIAAALADDPTLVERYSWPEIERMGAAL